MTLLKHGCANIPANGCGSINAGTISIAYNVPKSTDLLFVASAGYLFSVDGYESKRIKAHHDSKTIMTAVLTKSWLTKANAPAGSKLRDYR